MGTHTGQRGSPGREAAARPAGRRQSSRTKGLRGLRMAGTRAILAAELPEPAPRRAAPQAFSGERPEARKGGLTCLRRRPAKGRPRSTRGPRGEGRTRAGARGRRRGGGWPGAEGPGDREAGLEHPASGLLLFCPAAGRPPPHAALSARSPGLATEPTPAAEVPVAHTRSTAGSRLLRTSHFSVLI